MTFTFYKSLFFFKFQAGKESGFLEINSPFVMKMSVRHRTSEILYFLINLLVRSDTQIQFKTIDNDGSLNSQRVLNDKAISKLAKP